MRRLIRVVVIMLAIIVCVFGQTSVFADDPLDEACKSAPKSSTCISRSPNKNPLTGTDGLLYKIASILSVVAGVAAVIVLIVGGLRYITSGGDAQKAASAKQSIVGALIGLVVIVLAQAVVTFVVRRL